MLIVRTPNTEPDKINYLLKNGWYSTSSNALPIESKSIHRWTWWAEGYKRPIIGIDAAVLLQQYRDTQNN